MKKLTLLLTMMLTATLAVQAQKIPGTADSSFNGNGFKTVPPQEKSTNMVSGYLDNAKKPVLLSGSQNVQFKWNVGSSRLNTDGSLDLSFKNNGFGLIDLDPTKSEYVNDVFVSASGNVWGVGSLTGPNGTDMWLFKTDLNGVLDLNFGDAGILHYEIDVKYDRGEKIIEDKNGNVVVLGEAPFSTKTIYVARFLPQGGIDSSFSADGVLPLQPLDETNDAVAIIERPKGGYYVICNTSGNGTDKITVMSISANGNYNIDLGGPGEIQFQYDGKNTRAKSVQFLNGSLIIAGNYDSPQGNSDGFITRLEVDGTINTTFNQTGFNFIRKSLANPAEEYVMDMTIAEDSSIFVATISVLDSNMLIISRFQPDGNVFGLFGNTSGHHHTYLPGSVLQDLEINKILLDEEKERLYLLGDPNSGPNQDLFVYAVYTGKFTEKGGASSIQRASKLALRLYPNPASQSVHLDLPIEELTVDIYSIQGQLIAQYQNTNQLNVSGYANGTYFVVAHSAGAVYSSRLQITNH